jgi:uncharacterized LabA/DUF88 family protein
LARPPHGARAGKVQLHGLAETRLKIAAFIDFDNIEIGVKSTLNAQFDIGIVLEALKERGEVVSKVAYGDWTRAGDYSRSLTQHATKLVQRNLTPGGDKNGADINLALDALEMAFTHPHINAYVIVGGDSDFISLVEKLKQYDKQVFVVGGRSFTSHVMQRNCHEFIAYENLGGGRRGDRGGRQSSHGGQQTTAVEQAMPLVRRALKVLSDREVTPQLGLLKSTLLQLDSTFSERNYGVSSFRDFAQKLANAGFVTLRENGRNVLVELKEGATPVSEPTNGGAQEAKHEARHEHHEARHEPRETRHEPRPEPRTAEAVAEVRRLFQNAQNPPRWPMYVRQVKQFLRTVDPTFDERTFGFHSLNDLLRACQRDGLFRMERDRQGVMRFFQGNVMRPLDGEAGGTPESEAEAQIRHGREAAAAADAEAEVVDGDVVQEIDAAPPVIEVAESAAVEEHPEATTEAQPIEELPARGKRKRAAKTASSPRARKTAGGKTRSPRKKSADA